MIHSWTAYFLPPELALGTSGGAPTGVDAPDTGGRAVSSKANEEPVVVTAAVGCLRDVAPAALTKYIIVKKTAKPGARSPKDAL